MTDLPVRPDIVYYHSPCTDGLVGAWLISRFFVGHDIKFVPFNYGENFLVTTAEFEGKHVLFVDVSVSKETLVTLASTASRVTVLDHHKTARENLEGLNDLPNVEAVFDMERSGAGLAWWYLHRGDEPLPRIVELVQDRDLWLFKDDPETTWFHRLFDVMRQDFEGLDSAARLVTGGMLSKIGPVCQEAYDGMVAELAGQAYFVTIAGHVVPLAECGKKYASDVGHALLKRHPDAPFAACFAIDEKGVNRFSLRSEDARADVSAIASQYGGGGHRNAAGFQFGCVSVKAGMEI